MHETSSNPSSSAAAVADSASAAANTKSADASVAAPATSVKLLIKASNQQFDDQTIECDLLWSVKRLKTQLSLVYPSKPAVSDQKLIYSGQLLSDALLLKDVIRSYKDVHTQNHIFHIVCASKQLPPYAAKQTPKASTADTNSSSNSTVITSDGLRYRNVAANLTQQQELPSQQQQQSAHSNHIFNPQLIPQILAAASAANRGPQCPDFNLTRSQNMMPFSFPEQFNMQSLATQQAAMYNWMQQVYSQYMDQCIRLSNNATGGLPPMPSANAPAANNMPFGVNPFIQHMPFMSNTGPAANFGAFAPGAASPVLPFPSDVQPEAAVATSVSAPAPQVAAAEQQPVAAAVGAGGDQQVLQQQLPRFPNLAQDDQEHNDWLDNFFSLTRLAIFLTILFFNTSPLRCLLVVIIAGGIYLYHIGVFRIRGERNNNNINRNNNAADAANQIRQGVQEVQQAQAQQQQHQDQPQENLPIAVATAGEEAPPAEPANPNNVIPSAEPAQAPAQAVENGTSPASVISFVRTFVVSFFTSLLPETTAQ